MRLSRERLQREATATGFRVEILEKVAQLLDLLDGFNRHPYLKGRLALKGGTALNPLVFDVPRLSIDIDLTYVGQLDPQPLRIAFVVYGAMNRKDWRTVSADDITFEPRELRNQLVPTLRPEALGGATAPIAWARSLNDECRDALRVVLPLAEAESEFLERLLDHGEIVPALLTNDPALGERNAFQPMLAWKALNVRRHKDNK